ncbi:hypothetical protein PENSPDRAFT_658799 [Peniophora sp. CONT]|nr:hypothetical protein PENSPDRAFT_658799 [Peniophora sp. CONT]
MTSNSPVDLLAALVSKHHKDGILLYVLGLEEMCRRINAITVRYNHGNPAEPRIYQAFVTYCYREGDRPPLLPLVPGAISLYAGPEALFEPSRFAHRYASDTNQLYYIIDITGYDLSFIVPLGRYVPYKQYPAGRAAIVLDSIEPTPLWVVGHSGGLGVPVGGGNIQSLHHGDRQFTYADGRLRTTVFVKIEASTSLSWFLDAL